MNDLEKRMAELGVPLVQTPFTGEVFSILYEIIGEQVPLDSELEKILDENFWDLCAEGIDNDEECSD